jgi:hypothetical protein
MIVVHWVGRIRVFFATDAFFVHKCADCGLGHLETSIHKSHGDPSVAEDLSVAGDLSGIFYPAFSVGMLVPGF